MEDKERRMAPTEQEVPDIEKKPRHKSHLTIMIIRSLGQVRSFKISPHIVFWATLFFVIYIPVSLFVINEYIGMYRASTTQSKKIELLEKEVFNSKKSLDRFQQHVSLLEAYIHHLEEPQKERSASPKAENSRRGSIASNPEGLAKDRDDGEESAGVVDIKDMIIQKDGTRMTVDFKLVNMTSGETAVGGYIHMIAMGNDDDPPLEWTFPRVRVQEGIPVNFRRGQLFLIQWFKPVHGKFDFAPNSEPPTAIKVLVYDQSGVLLLEKEFEVSHVS